MEQIDKAKLKQWLTEHKRYYRELKDEADTDVELMYAVGQIDACLMLEKFIDKSHFDIKNTITERENPHEN